MNEHKPDAEEPRSDEAGEPALAAEPAAPAEASAASGKARFGSMELDEGIVRALADMGFVEPMEVQEAVYAPAAAGRDLMVQSKTGSGKTAAFGIPIIERMHPEAKYVQALCLCPTRELALQVANECTKIAAYSKHVSVVPIYGGAPMGRQIEELRAGAQFVVGTPGRVMDHLRRGTLKLGEVRVLVLDEADEMLSMGFLEDILTILAALPRERQTLLFSATVPEEIQRIAARHMRDAQKIVLSGDFIGVEEIRHVYYLVSGIGRPRDLERVLEFERPDSAIIFCNTREDTGLVASYLQKQGFHAEAISSDLSQKDRERVMGMKKRHELQFLVATDIAARGIDITDLSHVINFQFPESAEVYVHRTGRTGRAGKSGIAISLVAPRELGALYYLRLLYKIKPEERALPTEDDLATRREGERYEQVARSVRGDVGAEWRSLARRVWSSAEGERIVGALLKQTLEREVMAPAGSTAPVETVIAKEAAPPEASAQPEREAAARPPPIERERRRERGARSERPERGGRADRPERGGRGRRGERREARDGRGERGRGEKEKERERERGERSRAEKPVSPAPPPPPAVAGAGAPAPEPRPARPLDDEREFWEAWVDERNVPESPGRAEPSPERAGEPSAEPPAPALEPGMARLYLNLGRRDRVRAADVQQMVAERTGLADVKLQVRNTHTYLIVREADVQSVISALHGTRYSERDLVCEPAKKS